MVDGRDVFLVVKKKTVKENSGISSEKVRNRFAKR